MENQYTTADLIQLFREILQDAEKSFRRPAASITEPQFGAVSNGRLGYRRMARCGGFIALRDFVTSKKKPLPVTLVSRTRAVKRD